MRFLVLLALVLAGCGHHGSASLPAAVVGTWSAHCTTVAGSAPASDLGTDRSLHVSAAGVATFNDDSGTAQQYGVSGSSSPYTGNRVLPGGDVETIYIDTTGGVLRLSHHNGDATAPVVSGTAWALVKLSGSGSV